ncbi:MAG TPA: hypothetical protein VFQ39_03990, partial [Longimicrobium sp.]|nr:hypothetical protein [Longimicrobium sp.]
LECGTTNAGKLANVYQVRLRLTTTVAAAPGGGSALTTSVVGTARNPGSSSAPVRCTTTGKLEEMIHGQVARLAGG